MTKDDLLKSSVLVVDDDEFSREIISTVLNRLGIERVVEAHNGEAAYRIGGEVKPDFVLLDIYMPDVDGWEVAENLRRILPEAVIVMVTGSRDFKDFDKALQRGVDGYFVKPVLPDIMQNAMLKAAERREYLQKRES